MVRSRSAGGNFPDLTPEPLTMRIGYPCLNYSLPCRGNLTFKLRGFTRERLLTTVASNLACLEQILAFNVEQGLGFFRITSDLVPFASHPICDVDWSTHFDAEFARIGQFVIRHDLRISMHPDQYTLLNSPDEEVVQRSIRELEYHAEVLDRMNLDAAARIQIHVGGVYGNREEALQRFVTQYERLPDTIRRRLVIENDDRLFCLAECVELHARTGVPVLFDVFHHAILHRGEPVRDALASAAATWRTEDGPLMVDYSSQQPAGRVGKHADTLDPLDFTGFLRAARGLECDVMLEIKDKEQSALRAVEIYRRESSRQKRKAKS